jgi:NAD(P)-dependent dehydrogenase (short-subunit alcohol dehydrogenase family)
MAGRLANKTVLITGGNSGIGLATARLFVAEGARVAITGRNQDTLDTVAKELGDKVLAVRADATDIDALEAAVAATVKAFGKIDVLFANAGIGGATPLGSTSLKAFDEIIRTNLTAVFFTVQAAAPHLSDNASVILNGSVHTALGMPGFAAYAATKAGVTGMMRVLASELAPRDIRVNVVAPGGTRTPIWKGAAPTAEAFQALEQRIAHSTPLGRMGEAEDIAKTALFLASDDSTHVSAMEIFVDGGAIGARMGAALYRG